jgi:hypothetical protein
MWHRSSHTYIGTGGWTSTTHSTRCRASASVQRSTAWAFAQAVLSAVWDIEDQRALVRGLATAEALLPLL